VTVSAPEVSRATAELRPAAVVSRTGARHLPPSLIGGLVIFGIFTVLAVVPGLIAPYSPLAISSSPLQAPSWAHLLGTDEIGRDVLSRVIFATRTELVISLVATLFALIVGSILGLVTAYAGGTVDTVGMRVVDLCLAFPGLVFLLFLIEVAGSSLTVAVVGIAITMTPAVVRVARGVGLELKIRSYVEACRVLNASRWYVVRRHLVPNALPPLLVAGSVLGAGAILITATLSFLGFGVQAPAPSWGGMLSSAFTVVSQAPVYGVAPGVCITLVAYAYMLLGRGIRELHASGGRP
jgi:peptide/nickel transport system permease protein